MTSLKVNSRRLRNVRNNSVIKSYKWKLSLSYIIMTAKTVAMIIIILYNVRICQSRRYDNFTLYSTVPTEADHLKFLQNLAKQKYINMMFWKKPSKLFEDVQFIVSPSDDELFNQRADHFNLRTHVMLENVGSAFEAQYVKKYSRKHTESFTWNYYHTLEDIYRWLIDMSVKYPKKVTLHSIGKSAEGREIYAVTVKKGGNKQKVIVEGGVHGNEWIGVEFVTYLVNELVAQNNPKHWLLHKLSNRYDWYIIPIVNPDGYAYSHTMDRLWRKNRRVSKHGIGADINRNFDGNFGKFDTSDDPKDDYYHGSHPFSEPETRALADFITASRRNLRFYFTFHAYGQKILLPFGDRINHLGNYGEMENYGKQAIIAMYQIYGKKYSVGTAFDTLGLRISGNSATWVKRNLAVKYVFSILLRDNGTYGHALPPAQILPTCDETIAGLTTIMTAKPKRVKLNLFAPSKAQDVKPVLSYFVPLILFHI